MVPAPHFVEAPGDGSDAEAAQRFAFLVTTTGCAGRMAQTLGSPAYSYAFVLEALVPVLERFGTWQLVDRPESRLPFLARAARERGDYPVHLSLNPLQDAYFTSELPNIAFPFWEFPRVPDRDFGWDVRQNWARMGRPLALILTACHFTAEAMRRALPHVSVHVVPVPVDPTLFELPRWEPRNAWTFHCRHTWLGPDPSTGPIGAKETPTDQQPGNRGPLSRVFRQLAPRLNPRTVQKLVLAKRALANGARSGLRRQVTSLLRGTYRSYVKRWISDEGRQRITRFKSRLLRRLGLPVDQPTESLPPGQPLALSGLVFTTIFNLGDPRKNYKDLITAYLLAFRERIDLTLVIKLVTNPERERNELVILRDWYESLGLDHDCRVVVITEFLDRAQMRELIGATTFYVNTSHSEGACIPLMEALASGRPAIAPRHSALLDFMDDQVGFTISSHAEPAAWPHDPEQKLETERHRIVWDDLHRAYLAAARIADQYPDRYEYLAASARTRMAERAGIPTAAEALGNALQALQPIQSSSCRAGCDCRDQIRQSQPALQDTRHR